MACYHACMGNPAHVEGWSQAPGVTERLEGVGRTILVVDDDANLRDLIELLLRREGYRVVTAADLASAQAHLRTGAADLVVLDLPLPDAGGLTLLQQLKLDPDVVLVVTAVSDAGYRARCAELAAGFICKPFRGRDLVAEVGRILDGRH